MEHKPLTLTTEEIITAHTACVLALSCYESSYPSAGNRFTSKKYIEELAQKLAEEVFNRIHKNL